MGLFDAHLLLQKRNVHHVLVIASKVGFSKADRNQLWRNGVSLDGIALKLKNDVHSLSTLHTTEAKLRSLISLSMRVNELIEVLKWYAQYIPERVHGITLDALQLQKLLSSQATITKTDASDTKLVQNNITKLVEFATKLANETLEYLEND